MPIQLDPDPQNWFAQYDMLLLQHVSFNDPEQIDRHKIGRNRLQQILHNYLQVIYI